MSGLWLGRGRAGPPSVAPVRLGEPRSPYADVPPLRAGCRAEIGRRSPRARDDAGSPRCVFLPAGDQPADQGARGQLRSAARQPAEGVEQLAGEEGACAPRGPGAASGHWERETCRCYRFLSMKEAISRDCHKSEFSPCDLVLMNEVSVLFFSLPSKYAVLVYKVTSWCGAP